MILIEILGDGQMRSTLVFVYNAESGLFNTLADIGHKILSPQTYSCNLCKLTHSNFGMRKQWKQFIESLDWPVEFLHADELKARYNIEGLSLPVIMKREDEKLETLIDADAINACRSVEDLKRVIVGKLS